MSNTARYFACTLLLFLLTAATANSQVTDFPVPPNNPKQLFYLQRPANTNTLIYELNMENGVLNKEQPIHVYWIVYTKNGRTEELSGMEKRYAYGVKTTEVKDNTFQFSLVADKNLIMSLSQGADKQYHVYATANNKQIIVTRIFLQVKGGSLFKPNIDYVLLKGIDTATGAEVEEQIKM